MKSPPGMTGMLPAVLFFATGVFWAGILATGGGVLLAWAALTCFASGAFLIVWSSNWVTRPLNVATALFGLVLTVYQVYLSLTIVGTGLGSLAAYSSAAFALFTIVYVYLLFTSLAEEKQEH